MSPATTVLLSQFNSAKEEEAVTTRKTILNYFEKNPNKTKTKIQIKQNKK